MQLVVARSMQQIMGERKAMTICEDIYIDIRNLSAMQTPVKGSAATAKIENINSKSMHTAQLLKPI